MPTSAEGFIDRTQSLKADLVAQGRRVQAMISGAFDAIFTSSAQLASDVKAQDDEIDSVDVAIERACVDLLTDATRSGAELSPEQLRAVLMIVKINNELERTADIAVELAELVIEHKLGVQKFPDTFRVMANSVVGIVRDVNTCVANLDPALANIVLQSQHAVTAFKDAIVRTAELKLSKGEMSAELAFTLHEIATACEIIADHCTNIAEQVIYLTTGAIVRHGHSSWERVGGQ
jgi:phosphate transport system protein